MVLSYVRIMPQTASEPQPAEIKRVGDTQLQLQIKGHHPVNYGVHSVFGDTATNGEVSERINGEMWRRSQNGRWPITFAYGPSGSGKTWTIMNMTPENLGIFPSMVAKCWRHVRDNKKEVSLMVCLVETDVRESRDLMRTGKKLEQPLIVKTREGIANLPWLKFSSQTQMMTAIRKAFGRREVGATVANAQSSRKNLVAGIRLPQEQTTGRQVESETASDLIYVDFCGSELPGSAPNQQETGHINQMLFDFRSMWGRVKNRTARSPKIRVSDRFLKLFVPYFLRDAKDAESMQMLFCVKAGYETKKLINIGSQYNYGNEDQAEFLCVVSREYGASQISSKEQEATDRVKVLQQKGSRM